MIVYRVDTRTPEEVFRDGFKARGNDLDHLKKHTQHPYDESGYISTSKLSPFQMMDTSLKGFIENSALNNAVNNCYEFTAGELQNQGLEQHTVLPHQRFHGEVKSYVYQIRINDNSGVDVNNVLDQSSQYQDQQEIAVKLRISPDQILGCYEITRNFPSGNLSIGQYSNKYNYKYMSNAQDQLLGLIDKVLKSSQNKVKCQVLKKFKAQVENGSLSLDQLQTNLLQFERLVTHKKFGFRSFGSKANSYKLIKNDLNNLRIYVELPVDQKSINSNIESKKSPRHSVLTFSQYQNQSNRNLRKELSI